MKTLTLLTGALASLAAAQTAAPYTDAKSGITFNTFQHSSGLFFGLALPANATESTDFIATIGGKGTGYSGVSLGSAMLSKLLFVAWPNQQSVLGSFRKTAYVVDYGLHHKDYAYIAAGAMHRQQSRQDPSLKVLSQTEHTSTARTGHTPSSAPSVSRPTVLHSKPLIPRRALASRSTLVDHRKRRTLHRLLASIPHRDKQCLI